MKSHLIDFLIYLLFSRTVISISEMKLLNTIRILSRKSDLANIQAKEVGLLLKEKYPELTVERWQWFDRAEYDKTHPAQGSHDKYANDIYKHMKV